MTWDKERADNCGFDHVSPPMNEKTGEYEWEEGYFSRHPCEACGTTLGGMRIDGVTLINGEVVEVTICLDCLMYFANGETPEEG